MSHLCMGNDMYDDMCMMICPKKQPNFNATVASVTT